MALRSSLVTPTGRLDIAQQHVSLSKDAKVEYRPVGLQERQVGVIGTKIVVGLVTRLTWTCTHTTSNFSPNEYRGVVDSSGLVVYKGSNARDKKD